MISTCRSVDCVVFFQLLPISSSPIMFTKKGWSQEAEKKGEVDIQLIEERLEFPH
jgi:hypothetical protein